MILADENLPFNIQEALEKEGIEVYSIAKKQFGISDAEVIKLSKYPPRIILTEDKDFGAWVYAHKETDISVILLRYEHPGMEIIIDVLINLIKTRGYDLFGKFTTITPDKIRIRKI